MSKGASRSGVASGGISAARQKGSGGRRGGGAAGRSLRASPANGQPSATVETSSSAIQPPRGWIGAAEERPKAASSQARDSRRAVAE